MRAPGRFPQNGGGFAVLQPQHKELAMEAAFAPINPNG